MRPREQHTPGKDATAALALLALRHRAPAGVSATTGAGLEEETVELALADREAFAGLVDVGAERTAERSRHAHRWSARRRRAITPRPVRAAVSGAAAAIVAAARAGRVPDQPRRLRFDVIAGAAHERPQALFVELDLTPG